MRKFAYIFFLMLLAVLATGNTDASAGTGQWGNVSSDVTACYANNFSQQAKIAKETLCECTCKLQVRRKIKVRYRARDIELIILFAAEKNNSYVYGGGACASGYISCLSCLALPSFRLRGPPSLV